ncbi:hypothetical protein ACHAWF_017501 [Thalassiosira exigua]
MPSNGTELCFGLVLLLEAAEYHNANMVTPPSDKNRADTPRVMKPKRKLDPILSDLPRPTKLTYKPKPSSLPPKKRIKIDSNGTWDCTWLDSARSPLRPIQFSPIKRSKKSHKCSGGSGHRVWEQSYDVAGALKRRFDAFALIEASEQKENVPELIECPKKDDVPAANEDIETFVLYDKNDDEHINALHNVVRRDIWEGFVVDASKELQAEEENDERAARRSGRLARYEGTIGFRCRFCKHASPGKRAERAAVYPRSLERIYLANIRFQREHVAQCAHIPDEIKQEYARLKSAEGVSRGRKQYWVSSALRRGLRNGENGIVFSEGTKK